MTTADLISRIPANSAGFSEQTLAELNRRYRPLSPFDRVRELFREFAEQRILVTSSFAATSAFLLHVVHTLAPSQIIHFIDTGFHFPETLAFKERLTRELGLQVVDIKPDEYHYRYALENQLWKSDPDLCCSVNKVQPLDAVKLDHDIWISSLMGFETEHRAGLEIFEVRKGIVKFNPFVDLSRETRDQYMETHALPLHPLVAEGYGSIGCSHCTSKGEGRSGRWSGQGKTECGLHL